MSFKTEVTLTVAQMKEILIAQLAPMYPNHTVKSVRFTLGSIGDDRFGSTQKEVTDVKVELEPKAPGPLHRSNGSYDTYER